MTFRYPTRGRGVAGLARGRRGPRPDHHRAGAARRLLHRRAGAAGRAGRAVRCRQDDDRELVPRIYDVHRPVPSWSAASTYATRPCIVARHHRRGHPGRAPVPRDDRREPAATPGPTRPTTSCGRAGRGPDRGAGPQPARRAGHRGRRPRLPVLRRREAAHRDRAAAAEGARHRHPRRGDRPSGQRVRGGRAAGARRRRWPAGPRSSSPTGCPPSARPTRSSSSTAGASSSAARTTSCSPPAASTPSSTAPSSPSSTVRPSNVPGITADADLLEELTDPEPPGPMPAETTPAAAVGLRPLD